MDPLKDEYLYYTSYHYAGNKPINSIDIDGLEGANQVEEKNPGQQADTGVQGTENEIQESDLEDPPFKPVLNKPDATNLISPASKILFNDTNKEIDLSILEGESPFKEFIFESDHTNINTMSEGVVILNQIERLKDNFITLQQLKDLSTGLSGNLGAAFVGIDRFVDLRLKEIATKAFIMANPKTFPGGVEANRKLIKKGIENVTFFPNKAKGGASIGIKGVKFKSVEALSLSGQKIGNTGTAIDVGLIILDFGLGFEEGFRTGNYNNAGIRNGIRNTIVLQATLRIHPIIGPVVALYDITMAKDGKRIYANLAREAKKDYLKYRNSDRLKAINALESYKKFGGTECLNCMPSNQVLTQGRR